MDSLLDYDQDLLAPPWGSLGRDVVLGTVAAFSKLILNVLNATHVLNHTMYTDLVYNRPPEVGLLTVSNHTSTFDDPGLPCAMLPLSFFWTEHTHLKNRWTMCASDICFTNELFRQFFLNGKVLPVERGAGVSQPAISVAAKALGGGDWLHIFPEGRVVPDGRVGPFRQGIGKLICEARAASGRDPVILPFFHSGMSRVMPFKASLPRVGHTVTVAVGQPLDITHITCRCNQPGEDQQQVWRDIAAALRHAVMQLEDQVPTNPNQLERPDVAAWEQRYQERQRRRREQQQQLTGTAEEPSFMQQHKPPPSPRPPLPQQQLEEVQQMPLLGVIMQGSRQQHVVIEQVEDAPQQAHQQDQGVNWWRQQQKQQQQKQHHQLQEQQDQRGTGSAGAGSSAGGWWGVPWLPPGLPLPAASSQRQ